jgi:hypothetical protein
MFDLAVKIEIKHFFNQQNDVLFCQTKHIM